MVACTIAVYGFNGESTSPPMRRCRYTEAVAPAARCYNYQLSAFGRSNTLAKRSFYETSVRRLHFRLMRLLNPKKSLLICLMRMSAGGVGEIFSPTLYLSRSRILRVRFRFLTFLGIMYFLKRRETRRYIYRNYEDDRENGNGRMISMSSMLLCVTKSYLRYMIR